MSDILYHVKEKNRIYFQKENYFSNLSNKIE